MPRAGGVDRVPMAKPLAALRLRRWRISSNEVVFSWPCPLQVVHALETFCRGFAAGFGPESVEFKEILCGFGLNCVGGLWG